MTKLGTRQKPIIYKVIGKIRNIKLLLRDQMQAMDTRDAAARWLGDPPAHRSALAQRCGLRTNLPVPEKAR